MDLDPLGDQYPWVEPPDPLYAQEPLVVDVTDQEPDLVHMGGDGDACPVPATASREIAQCVYGELVDEWPQVPGHDLSHAVLARRDAWSLGQLTKQLDIDWHGLPFDTTDVIRLA
jgi:hypothetical protein